MLGGIFIAAAYYKLEPRVPSLPWSAAAMRTSLAMFAMQVDSYQMLSSSQANFVAHMLPFFELLIGVWLVSGVWLRIPSLLTTLMLGGFLTAMIRAYALGLEINCGCFGPGEKVGRDVILARWIVLCSFARCDHWSVHLGAKEIGT